MLELGFNQDLEKQCHVALLGFGPRFISFHLVIDSIYVFSRLKEILVRSFLLFLHQGTTFGYTLELPL